MLLLLGTEEAALTGGAALGAGSGWPATGSTGEGGGGGADGVPANVAACARGDGNETAVGTAHSAGAVAGRLADGSARLASGTKTL